MVDENKSRKMLRVFSKVHAGPPQRDLRRKAYFAPGSRRYLGNRYPPGGWRAGDINILTTRKRWMSGRSARKAKVGGEILASLVGHGMPCPSFRF
jgi:ribosomal protein S8